MPCYMPQAVVLYFEHTVIVASTNYSYCIQVTGSCFELAFLEHHRSIQWVKLINTIH